MYMAKSVSHPLFIKSTGFFNINYGHCSQAYAQKVVIFFFNAPRNKIFMIFEMFGKK